MVSLPVHMFVSIKFNVNHVTTRLVQLLDHIFKILSQFHLIVILIVHQFVLQEAIHIHQLAYQTHLLLISIQAL